MIYNIRRWQRMLEKPSERMACLRETQLEAHNRRVSLVNRPRQMDYERMAERLATLAASVADRMTEQPRPFVAGVEP